MKTRQLTIRGLRTNIQEWGNPEKPLLFLLHGWMDCGATFKYIAKFLEQDYFIVAPDWRGFGETEHVSGYWFPDYFADLECLIEAYSPNTPVNLVGHSMGGNIVLMYSGIRPEKVAKVMSLEALGMLEKTSKDAPKTYRRWLNEILANEETKTYPNRDALKDSISVGNPDLSDELVTELSYLWGREINAAGQMQLKHDHAHRYVNPIRYNFEDVLAIWQEVTAQVAVVMAEGSQFYANYLRGGRIDLAYQHLPFNPEHYYLVKQAGHMLHIEQPQRVSEAIADFFT